MKKKIVIVLCIISAIFLAGGAYIFFVVESATKYLGGHSDVIAGVVAGSRALIDACRPFEWMKDFPPVAESSPELRDKVRKKWRKIIEG